MQLETNPEIQRLINVIYDQAAQLKRGDILPHRFVKAILGCDPHEGSWDHIVNSVRRRLERERGIATWFVTSVGYQLLSVEDQLGMLPRKRIKKGMRQLRRGRKSVEALPEKGLTLHQQRAKAFLSNHMKSSESILRRQLRDQELTERATPVPARRPMPALSIREARP